MVRRRTSRSALALDRAFALVDHERAAGIILTRQAHPLSDVVRIDYDI